MLVMGGFVTLVRDLVRRRELQIVRRNRGLLNWWRRRGRGMGMLRVRVLLRLLFRLRARRIWLLVIRLRRRGMILTKVMMRRRLIWAVFMDVTILGFIMS